jgi:hypothetical protein
MRLCNCEDASLAVIVISHARLDLLSDIVQSIAIQEPDELLVVGSCIESANFSHLTVAPITNTTVDALIKRDAGTVATQSQYLCYLSDDHKLAPGFVQAFRERYAKGEWDILVPTRYTVRGNKIYPLPVGHPDQWTPFPYAAGHCAVFKREWIRKLPWTAAPHHRNWDSLHSKMLVDRGARLVFAGDDLAVEDVEPNGRPWES